jgi:hypothetical protein
MELKDILICHYFYVFRKDLNNYTDYKKEVSDIFLIIGLSS